MNTILILSVLLAVTGLYTAVRGFAVGKPIPLRNKPKEIVDMFAGVVGFYIFSLAVCIIGTALEFN